MEGTRAGKKEGHPRNRWAICLGLWSGARPPPPPPPPRSPGGVGARHKGYPVTDGRGQEGRHETDPAPHYGRASISAPQTIAGSWFGGRATGDQGFRVDRNAFPDHSGLGRGADPSRGPAIQRWPAIA